MAGGYYKTHRKIFNNDFLKDHRRFYIFHQILQSASHEKTVYRGVTLMPGEFTTSYRAFAERCMTPLSYTRSTLKALKKYTMIDITPSSHHIKITVINWEKYQSTTQEVHNKSTISTQKVHLSRNKNKEIINNTSKPTKKLVPSCDFFKCNELNEWIGELPKTILERWYSYGHKDLLEQVATEAKEHADTSSKKYKAIARFVDNWFKRSYELKPILQELENKKNQDKFFEYLDGRYEHGKKRQIEKKSTLHSRVAKDQERSKEKT